ncbi:MAG: FAD-binding oxidoreductase [Gammaproteobacteria bacterium]|nr:FAD-binding oxidoreductase [Gammaproteobacteria bacterium]
MRRRELLRQAALLPFIPWLATAPAAAPLRRVRPGDSGWPAPQAWEELRRSLQGELIAVQPLTAPCAAGEAAQGCVTLRTQLSNPFFLGDQPAGTQVSGWLDAWTPAPSVYAVRAAASADMAAAVNFARAHALRLVIKGGGHSYQGTSCAPDSLLLWTRGLDRIELHESFVPAGCAGRVAPAAAVSVGAGCVWIDVYHKVTREAGRYVQGGGCTSVGVAGLIQSGGFGSFSKGFGSAAASLLEAEVVTADGHVRVVNAVQDAPLFWALKGGGGGSWGVVTRLTLRTHELPAYFGGAVGTIEAASEADFQRLLARFVSFYAERLANPHWGEQVALQTQHRLKVSMVCQGLTDTQARAVWQPFFDWVRAAPQVFKEAEPLRAGAHDSRGWWDVEGNSSMKRDPRPGAPAGHGWWEGDQDQVGAWLHAYDSLWLPGALLAPAAQPRLVDALLAASRHYEVGLHFNKGLYGAPAPVLDAVRDTATNPEVTAAFALAIIAGGGGPAYPGLPGPAPDLAAARSAAAAIAAATAELRRVAPEAGSYVAESNYFNPRWQRDFFGTNYPQLAAIKRRYDPQGVFFVHHGVGSEDWSADGFTRKI